MGNKAVAVVGMCGSGKSVLTEMFTDRGWGKVYFGGVTVSQLKKQGIPINEQNERAMREGLRKQYGMGAFALLLADEIDQLLKKGNVVLDGLYSWSEYTIFKGKVRRRSRDTCGCDQQFGALQQTCQKRNTSAHPRTGLRQRLCRNRKQRKGRTYCHCRLLYNKQRQYRTNVPSVQ